MLKVVYVLVSSENDYYLEQFILSVTSLRYHNDNLDVWLVTDKDTARYLKKSKWDVNGIVDYVVQGEIDDSYSHKEKASILKCRLRKIIEGDFLFIDTDTVICDDLSKIEQYNSTSAVLDNHMRTDKEIAEFVPIKERAKRFGFSSGYDECHFNSGVMWIKDDDKTRRLFELWEELWIYTNKKGVRLDQLSFNEANARVSGVINEIDASWNCQLRYGINHISDARIIHYYASNMYGSTTRNYGYFFANQDVYKKLRECGTIDVEIQDKLLKPRSQFEPFSVVEVGSLKDDVLHSNAFTMLMFMRRRIPKVFKFIDKVLAVLRELVTRNNITML